MQELICIVLRYSFPRLLHQDNEFGESNLSGKSMRIRFRSGLRLVFLHGTWCSARYHDSSKQQYTSSTIVLPASELCSLHKVTRMEEAAWSKSSVPGQLGVPIAYTQFVFIWVNRDTPTRTLTLTLTLIRTPSRE